MFMSPKMDSAWQGQILCGLVTPYGDIDLVNIGSGNDGLLPKGTK